MKGLSERALFLRSFLANPREVGAVLPTSRRAVRDLLDLADLKRAGLVVELGAGTGVYTREILARLAGEARLLAFETDAPMAEALASELHDPRLRVVHDSAERVRDYLGEERADVIVSGLPYTTLPGEVRSTVLSEARNALTSDGTFLVLQYSPLVQRDLRRIFPSVSRRISPLNVPPAVLFACSADADGSSRDRE